MKYTNSDKIGSGKGKKAGWIFFSYAETVLLRKDIGEFWGKKSIRLLMIAMPLLLVVVIPIIFIVAICLTPIDSSARVPQAIHNMLPMDLAKLDYRQILYCALTGLLCPMFFIVIPIMSSITAGSSAFVSEKEDGTLESLFYTSLSMRKIFNTKVSGCVLMSLLISGISFVVFLVTALVGDIILSVPFFINLEWFVLVFLLSPAISLFGVVFSALTISKIQSTSVALQTMGYLLVPFILLFLLQLSGLYKLSPLFLLAIAVAVMVLDFIFFNIASNKFTSERLFAVTGGRVV